jgi:ADP-ribose pyrophosphatase
MVAWILLDVKPGSAGYLAVETHRFRMPDGSESDWDIFGKPRAVGVVAITEDEEVVLHRQFRPGPMMLLDELPGGYVEEGEDILAAAARELLEETGYAGELELAGSAWTAAACRMERFVAIAHGARKIADPTPDVGEFGEVVLVTLPEFRVHLHSGRLTDTDLGYIALAHLGMLAG